MNTRKEGGKAMKKNSSSYLRKSLRTSSLIRRELAIFMRNIANGELLYQRMAIGVVSNTTITTQFFSGNILINNVTPIQFCDRKLTTT